MKNKDLFNEQKVVILQKMHTAMTSNDSDGYIESFNELCDIIRESVKDEYQMAVQANDANVLAQRGFRQLTSAETNYYQKVIDAMKSGNPKQALTDLDVVMPTTVFDNVFEDLRREHPLLEEISFVNTSGLIEFILNTNGDQLAVWGTLTTDIVKELTSGFKKVNMGLNKLSAFIPVAKSMLDLGPVWMDKYIREILHEALALGLEEGIVNGTGKDMPIGMNRQVGDDVVVTGGVYPLKDTVALNSIDPVTYGDLAGRLAVDANGKERKVKDVLLVVNPLDYLTKVMPATTIRNAAGQYVNNVFPMTTKVCESVAVPRGKAIFGLGKKYFMGAGAGKNGKIDYSDEYKFLEDERVYLIKVYAHGEPLDNNAFLYLDITNLKPVVQQVEVTNISDIVADPEI